MSFTENLKVAIQSVFDSRGFKRLKKNLKTAKAEISGMQQLVRSARQTGGLRQFGRDFQKRMDRAGLSLQTVDQQINSVAQASSALSEMDVGLANFDSMGEAAAEAKSQVSQLGGFVTDTEGNLVRTGRIVSDLTNQFDQLGAMIEGGVPAEKDIPDPMQQFRGGDISVTSNVSFRETSMRSNLLSRSLGRLAGAANLSEQNMSRLSWATARASGAFAIMSSMASRAGDSLRSVSFNAQQVQMKLLGLQFQLLSLAFIFGGLMMSAFSAVGIFKILGNTLKMFFLPIALELLPVVLDIRDAILGVGEGTKKQVGKIFTFIAVFAALGSLLAFTVNGFLAVAVAVWDLTAPLRFLLRLVPGASRALGGLKIIATKLLGGLAKLAGFMKATLLSVWSGFVSLMGGVGTAILGVVGFIAGLVSAFLAVTTVAKKFGKKIAFAFAVVLSVVAAIVAAIVATPGVILAAIGVIVGAILGVIWTFRDTIISVLLGLKNALAAIGKGILDILLWPFKKAHQMIVGNSIIPDMVNSIINWLWKLPKAAWNAATAIVNNIVKGIKGIGSGIWNALKSVLPDFIVDAIEGAGQAIGAGVNAVGNFAGGVANAAGNFASGIGNTVSNLNPFGGGGGGGQTNVQQNNVNANVEVNDKEETPQETGRQFGQGLSNELNSRQSNFSGGT